MTAPPTQIRRGVLVAAVLIVLFVIGNGAVQLTSKILQTHLREDSKIVPLAQRLTVIADNGHVVLNPSPDDNVHVTVSGVYGGARPELIQTSTDAGVRLEERCGDSTLVSCRIDYDVKVPAGFDVQVHGTPTNVVASRLTGPVGIALEFGNISLNTVSGPVQVHTDYGRISGNQLSSTAVTATSSHGDVALDLTAPPDSLAVHAGFGDVLLRVPDGYAYRVSADSGTGDRTVGVMQDASAQRSITASTESGDVRVLARRASGPAPIAPIPPIAPPAPIAPIAPARPG